MTERDFFIEALQIEDPGERRVFLDRVCGDDSSLRERVETLLRAHEQGNSYLENPPVAIGETTVRTVIEAPGTAIGPYELIQRIGEGGMGVVYMAGQSSPVKRKVALKIIKPGMDTQQVITRFSAERQALALMDHPNIAKVLDAGATDSGRPYFVMELVNGIPITEYCDEHRLTPQDRLNLFIPICQAVQHAHQKGIIHRDLKPSNVLVAEYDDEAVPKVIDFGVAKATSQQLTEETLYTQLGQVVGTLEYMSPEQAKRNQLDVDTRSDVYSLGVLLYELLTGDTPLDRKQLHQAAFDEMLRIIREEQPPKPSTKVSGSDALPSVAANRRVEPSRLSALIRGDLDWIVMKALEKDRARRYETASAFAADIQHFLHDEPVLASPPSNWYRFRRFARRHRAGLATLSVLFLTVMAGLAGTGLQAIRAMKAERLARAQATEALRSEERALKSERKALANEAAAKEAAESERRARENEAVERKKAELITNFMLNAFRAPDPALRGRDITVAEVLQYAVKTLEERTDLDPQARADMLEAIGASYDALGLHDKQLEAYRQCLRIRTEHLGEGDRATLSAMNLVTLALHEAGELQEALRLYEETLALRDEHLGPDHWDTVQSKLNLASLYRELGRTHEALPMVEEVVAARRKICGEQHIDTLLAMNNWALTLRQAGRIPEAIKVFEQVLGILDETDGVGSPFYLLVMNNLGTTYMADKQYDKAKPLLEDVLEQRTAKLGHDHPETLNSMNNVGVLHGRMGNLDEAQSLCERALELRRERVGDEHPSLISPLRGMARFHRDQKNWEQAFVSFEAAVKLLRMHHGATHSETLSLEDELASAYDKAGRSPQAVALLEEIVSKRIQQQGESHPETLRSMNNLGTAYWHLKQLDRSIPIFEKLCRTAGDTLGKNAPNTLSFLTNLGVNYRDAGRFDEAAECLEDVRQRASDLPVEQQRGFAWVEMELLQAYEMANQFDKQQALLEERTSAMRRGNGVPLPVLCNTLAQLGLCLLKQEKYAEAEPLLRESLAGREENEHDAWYTVNTRSLLGESLMGQGKHDEAESLLVEGYRGLKQRAAQIRPDYRQQRLVEAAKRLIRLYDALGNEEESNRWQEEVTELESGQGIRPTM